MSDELDNLKAALDAIDPQPDADKKAAAIALAKKNFAAHQGIQNSARPTHKPTQSASGIWTGVWNMMNSPKTRTALYATSFLVVGGLGFLITQDMSLRNYTDAIDRITVDKAAEFDTAAPRQKPMPRAERSEVTVTPQPTAPVVLGKRETPKEQPLMDKSRTQSESFGQAPTLQALNDTNGQPAQSARKIKKPSQLAESIAPLPEVKNRDTFPEATPNPLKVTQADPVSTFSIDVDTASYAFVRTALSNGDLPPASAVRIEEMINYFPYDYAAPDLAEAPFSTELSVFETPWNPNTQLLHIGLQGAKPAVDARPPLNLVFLIDTSGSMNAPDKLPLLKKSFRLLLGTLRPEDSVAIVTYAGSAGTVLDPTPASEKAKILASLERLSSGGSTAGQAGLQQAYSLAESMAADGAIGRVILATDGDFNVGISNPDALKTFVEQKRDTGIYLSVLGFGNGNYRDDMMQSLAQNGNGTAAYIDTLAEAQKVLVEQAGGALFPIANDVKIQVEFNPEKVAEYRLIGYETRALNREDFNNDKVDAGEIGAGHTVTAIYEITPVGSPAVKNDPLRYAAKTQGVSDSDELGFFKLRYKDPGSKVSKLITTPIQMNTSAPTSEALFGASIAGMGQLLTQDKYLGDWDWQKNIALALSGKGADPFGYRAEAIQLMRLADALK
ncbi:hypothetical protein GCM10007939_14990 [Amylibacter marinus]|uniref:VWFA domain-containing protein n=1 Tax=Amylibacter marinus TaxID=1475483 RepID=A0ABQ5VVX2_9RHOB|nr:VWA domain-containing protein [Amylibacter marinus]GLQ35216.1 hypothetical protein GCM10007939_14990 [Amylibacter marinus]